MMAWLYNALGAENANISLQLSYRLHTKVNILIPTSASSSATGSTPRLIFLYQHQSPAELQAPRQG